MQEKDDGLAAILDKIGKSGKAQEVFEKHFGNFQVNMLYEEMVNEAADFLKPHLKWKPEFGIVLGSGLNDLADAIENPVKIPYEEIPNFPKLSVQGHEGVMHIGKIEGVRVIGLQGRKHYYEVADMHNGMLQVVFPVHLLANLNVGNYFATNATGGLNQDYKVGDIMVVKSHINMLPNALLGRQKDLKRVDGGEVWRFQPMNDAYDAEFRQMLKLAGVPFGGVHEGTLMSVTGPTYETQGESLAYKAMGADVVGMSVIPEVTVARNRGMRCAAFSCVTNMIAEDGTNATNHEEVVKTLNSLEVKERLSGVVQRFFRVYRAMYDKP